MSGPFPEDSAARKTYPLYSGVLQYFPAALAKVAHHSYLGNEKHNPGQPLHWARGKSDDHLDAAARHLAEGDLVGLAWRSLAALQLKCEKDGAPVAPGAKSVPAGLADDWISWLGGEMPVDGRTMVECRLRGDFCETRSADFFDWSYLKDAESDDDIIAYRVVKEGE